MNGDEKSEEKCRKVYRRLSKSITEINKFLENKPHESAPIRYAYFLFDAAVKCADASRIGTATNGFYAEEHDLSPLNCYCLLEFKQTRNIVLKSAVTLENIIMHVTPPINDVIEAKNLISKAMANLIKKNTISL